MKVTFWTKIELMCLMGIGEHHLRTTRSFMMKREVQRAKSKAFSKSVSGKKSKYKSKLRRYTNTKAEIEKRTMIQPRAGNMKFLGDTVLQKNERSSIDFGGRRGPPFSIEFRGEISITKIGTFNSVLLLRNFDLNFQLQLT